MQTPDRQATGSHKQQLKSDLDFLTTTFGDSFIKEGEECSIEISLQDRKHMFNASKI
ncbi:hypothetical protein [Paraglaciecola sp.]|uniref:hypothetical protein n=1 Tax=Paraglaciecola sp. TaxID=1920173 RepID=UPI003298179F